MRPFPLPKPWCRTVTPLPVCLYDAHPHRRSTLRSISVRKKYVCVCLKPLQVISAVQWVHEHLQIVRFASLSCGPVPYFRAVLCHRVQYVSVCACVSVCKQVQIMRWAQCVFLTSLGAVGCCVRDGKMRLYFQRTYQSPAFIPGLLFFFLWFDIIFQHFFVYYQLSMI